MTNGTGPNKRPRDLSFSESGATVSQWLPEKEIDQQVHIKNFLDQCHFCKKKLRPDQEVFMYGNFGAYCSNDCRGRQIARDVVNGLSRQKADAKKARMSKDSKDEALCERITTTPSSRSSFYI